MTLGAIAGTVVTLAGPAYSVPADAGERVPRPPAALVALEGGQPDVLLQQESVQGPLPFAAADVVLLVLGGSVVIVAAAGAPLFLRPRRPVRPALAGAVPDPQLLLPASVQGTAHASA